MAGIYVCMYSDKGETRIKVQERDHGGNPSSEEWTKQGYH